MHRHCLNITEVNPSFISTELTYSRAVIQCTVKICSIKVFLPICPQLNMTNDGDLPQDTITHNCQFRTFYLTLVGALTKDNWAIRYSA